jgi:CDP-diacylglycerol---glycerol-3-phosphate 3-phosphatidyltransferase
MLVPVICLLLLHQDGSSDTAHLWAAGLFVLGAASDFLDGYLARKHALTSRLGAWLDPFSDKLLVIAPMLVLVAQGEFPWWAAVVIIGREVAVSLLRAWLGSRSVSMPAVMTGKVKAVLQMAAIVFFILPEVPDLIRNGTLVLALVFTVWSGAEYFLGARARLEATE